MLSRAGCFFVILATIGDGLFPLAQKNKCSSACSKSGHDDDQGDDNAARAGGFFFVFIRWVCVFGRFYMQKQLVAGVGRGVGVADRGLQAGVLLRYPAADVAFSL